MYRARNDLTASLGFQRFLGVLGVLAVNLLCGTFLLSGCGKSAGGGSSGAIAVQLTLDWKPEPEFGGFYAAKQDGAFSRHGLDATITPAGEGADTWQLVATGKTEFATSSADQVLIARKQNADVIAIFAVYQTFPQGIMVHQSRGFKTMGDIFTSDGVLLAEDNAWLHFLENKFAPVRVRITYYSGGISEFLAKKEYSQQCFVTSEPILAKHQGGDPQTFLIADEGFNPYTTVVICKGDLWRAHPEEVKSMAAACREGWRDYLDQPDAVNATMHGLNADMDLQTFAEAAAAQKPLIETDQTRAAGLGTMTGERWKDLADQLVKLGVIDATVDPQQCFVNP
ncbi:MAG: ABC transporter substrate-binding protein [Tepidisphaeraceae bacterium]